MKSFFLRSILLLWSTVGFCQKHWDGPTPLFADTGITSIDYITYIENAIQQLSSIRTSSKLGYSVLGIQSDLPETDTTIRIMKESLKYGKHLDIRDLQMFEILIKDVQKKLASYKKLLDTTNGRIRDAADQMKALRKDSTWQELRKDTSAKRIFASQLKELRKKFKLTDSTLRANSQLVNAMTIHVANNTIVNADLLDQISGQVKKLSKRSFTKEQYCLWEKEPAKDPSNEVEAAAAKYYKAEKEALWFYVEESSGIRLLMLVVGVVFYWWVNMTYKNLEKVEQGAQIKTLSLTYLTKHPVLPSLIVVLTLSPFFDLTPPAIYITCMQFLLMLVLTWVFYTKWSRAMFLRWASLILFFLLLWSAHLISSSSFWIRMWFLILTLSSTVFGIFFWNQQKKEKEFSKYVKAITLLYCAFNFLSCIANLFGRWTLAQLFGSSAVFGLAQIIGLSVFLHIVQEAFMLNLHYSRQRNGLTQAFDPKPFFDNLHKALTWVALVLWVMVLASNLNIYNFLYDKVVAILTIPRKIGSITFNIGSILLFMLIIGLSSILQKYISYLFGDSIEEISKVNKKQHSKLLLARLVLLTAGFLLAVAASGLPVDKITIVLGALGVGIGLGLQNIVNNFVSGVILIFERPFQVGDLIEIGARKGKVREIGIRYSILLTADGGEVIVPNGDMLSNQIMNWTLSNDYMRLEIPLKIEAKENWDTITDIIKNVVETDERVLPSREPLVLLNNITADLIDFKVLVWCKEIRDSEDLKSDLIHLLYSRLKEKNIQTK